MVGVVGLVGNELSDRAGTLDQLRGDRDVVGIARGQDQDAGSSLLIGEGVELAGAAAAGLAEGLLERPPFPPAAER